MGGPIGVCPQSKGHRNQHQLRLASSEMLKWRRPLLWPKRRRIDREGEGKQKKKMLDVAMSIIGSCASLSMANYIV